jgi:flagellin-like hook-associated protein FlgL
MSALVSLNQHFLTSLNAHRQSSEVAMDRIASGEKRDLIKTDGDLVRFKSDIDTTLSSQDALRRVMMDGVALAQVADAGLEGAVAVLQELRSIAQSSFTNISSRSPEIKAQIQSLYQEVYASVAQLADSTEAFGIKPLASSEQIDLIGNIFLNQTSDMVSFQALDLVAMMEARGLGSTVDLTDESSVSGVLSGLSQMMDDLNLSRADIGGRVVTELNARYELVADLQLNIQKTRSDLIDSDVGEELIKMTLAQVREQTSMSMITAQNAIVQNLVSMLKS